MIFRTRTNGVAAMGAHMVIASDGNVGIGTDSPSRLLDVYNGTARIYQTTANSELLIGSGGTGTAGLVLDASNGDGAGSDYFYITQNNDLTVDIATPSSGGVVKLSSKGSLTQTLDGTKTTFNGNVVLGNIQSSINPLTDSTYDIGSNTGRWANVFADTLYGAGSNITSLNGSSISSGTVAAARLGSGSSITSKFLRGDNTWATPANTTYSAGTGLDLTSTTFSTKLVDLTDMTADIVGSQDELILLDNGSDRRKQINEIKLGQFNNDQGWTSNAGDITSVGAGVGLSGGGTSGSVTLSVDLSGLGTASSDPIGNDYFVFVTQAGASKKYIINDTPLSKFDNDSGWITSNWQALPNVSSLTALP